LLEAVMRKILHLQDTRYDLILASNCLPGWRIFVPSGNMAKDALLYAYGIVCAISTEFSQFTVKAGTVHVSAVYSRQT